MSSSPAKPLDAVLVMIDSILCDHDGYVQSKKVSELKRYLRQILPDLLTQPQPSGDCPECFEGDIKFQGGYNGSMWVCTACSNTTFRDPRSLSR